MGLLAAQQARHTGARVIGVDRYPLRLAAAEALGIGTILAEPGTDVAVRVRQLTTSSPGPWPRSGCDGCAVWTHLRSRRANAARIVAALPEDGALVELGYGQADAPNYDNLVLFAEDIAESFTAGFASAGLHPDSIRYGYRPLYHRPIFIRYAVDCPNAEALCAMTLQLPVHPGMSEAALEWIVDRIRTLATSPAERQRP